LLEADARPVLEPLAVARDAGWHALATARIAGLAPTRVSPGRPGLPAVASTSTQRILPLRTSCASHEVLTSLSRPENPPMPATFAFFSMIAAAALDWLETAIVPPP
jgi:hypothetical protein